MARGEKTGGRQAGTPNKSRYATMEGLGDGLLPLPYMLQILRDESKSEQARAWAAEKSAPYLYPKPAPEQRRVNVELPNVKDAQGIADAIGAIFAAVGRGELSTSEGKDMASMLELRLRALEAIDLEARIKRLEEART